MFVAILSLGVANAQFEIEAAPGLLFQNVSTSGVDVSAEDFQIQGAVSYDLAASKFLIAPEARGLLVNENFKFLPGLNVGHDNIYLKGNFDVDTEDFFIGIAGSIPLGAESGWNLKPQLMYNDNGLSSGLAGAVGVPTPSFTNYYGSIGISYKF